MLKHLLRGGSGIQGGSWVATLGYNSSDDWFHGRSVAIGPDGSVYVCGFTDPLQSTTFNDGFIAKFDSYGTLQWQKTLVGKYDEQGNSVAVGPDGSVCVCVYQYVSGAMGEDIAACLVVKFDSSGKLQFQKALRRSSHVYGQSVAVGLDGSVYVCGYMYSADPNSSYDCFIAKFDSSGALQWQKKLHKPSGSSKYSSYAGKSVAVGPDGSVYVCGNTSVPIPDDIPYNDSNVLIAKFDSSGVLQWQKTLGGSSLSLRNYDEVSSVAVGPDGSVSVCGYTGSDGAGNHDILVAKFNSSGSLQWQKTIGERYSDHGFSVAVGPDGSVYVCGEIGDKNIPKYNCLIVKFNPSGTLQWQKDFDYSYDSALAIGSDDSVYVCGRRSWDLLLARITAADINKSTVVCGPVTLQDVSVPTYNSYLRSETASLSVSNAGLSVSTASLTIADANYISNKYEGE